MSRFLKFSKYVINTSHITYILKTPNTYEVYFADHHVNGFFVFGSGLVDSTNRKMVYHNDGNSDDYAKLEQWINEITK